MGGPRWSNTGGYEYVEPFATSKATRPGWAFQGRLLRHGEDDAQAQLDHAQKMIVACGSKQKERKIFTREEDGYRRCHVDNLSIGTTYMWDWQQGVLRPRQ